jgi:hypothetical protein
MGARGSMLAVTPLATAAALVGVLEAAQRPLPQPPVVPRFEVMPPQRPRQPLFPLAPLEMPKPPQAPDALPNTPSLPNQSQTLMQKPRIVCGMTLIPAPDVDPKFDGGRETEKPRNPTMYTIRPLQPSICGD